MAEHALKLVFVFDGAPPVLKAQELARRRAVKVEFERARDEALARGDLDAAYSKATMTSRLTREMVSEAKRSCGCSAFRWFRRPPKAKRRRRTWLVPGTSGRPQARTTTRCSSARRG